MINNLSTQFKLLWSEFSEKFKQFIPFVIIGPYLVLATLTAVFGGLESFTEFSSTDLKWLLHLLISTIIPGVTVFWFVAYKLHTQNVSLERFKYPKFIIFIQGIILFTLVCTVVFLSFMPFLGRCYDVECWGLMIFFSIGLSIFSLFYLCFFVYLIKNYKFVPLPVEVVDKLRKEEKVTLLIGVTLLVISQLIEIIF